MWFIKQNLYVAPRITLIYYFCTENAQKWNNKKKEEQSSYLFITHECARKISIGPAKTIASVCGRLARFVDHLYLGRGRSRLSRFVKAQPHAIQHCRHEFAPSAFPSHCQAAKAFTILQLQFMSRPYKWSCWIETYV